MKRLLRNWLLLNNLCLLPFVTNSQSFQNLVINGSFETYTQCPTNNLSKIRYAPPWTGPTTDDTPYLNSCATKWNVPYYAGINNSYYYLLAKEGVAYTIIFIYHKVFGADYRTYAEVSLMDSLKSGQCYYVEFYASNLQRVKHRCNNISACFTSDTLPTHLLVPGIIPKIQPHITNYGNPVLPDTVNWQKISGIYVAIGGEKYITIGNFKDNANTDTVNIYPPGSYPYSSLPIGTDIFIDAVSVYSINPNGVLPWSYRDTTINKGDSVFIGNKMGGLNFHPQWFAENGAYLKTNAGITVSPTVTTKYIVQYTLCGVQRSDTVKVTVPTETDVAIQKLKIINEELKMYPVPANDILNIESETIDNDEDFELSIINNLGEMIRKEKIIFKESTAKIKTVDLQEGVYLLQLKTKDGTVSRKIVISR